MKILFVYPNEEGYPMLPLGPSILAGLLRDAGHEVDLFDLTFLVSKKKDQEVREKLGTVKKVDATEYWGETPEFDISVEYENKIKSFQPDLLCFSIVENVYGCAKTLIDAAKKICDTPILVGGVFPTSAPEFFTEDPNVDLVCVGEGEYLILEVAKRMENKENLDGIPNLITKTFQSTSYSSYYNWDPYALPNWEIFDERHLWKPFMGEMRRTGYFETARGCPHKCTYCVNQGYQEKFKDLGNYNRLKSVDVSVAEIKHFKDTYGIEFVWFNDENFMMMSRSRWDEFTKKYGSELNLPFFIQTRADTLLQEDRIKALKDINCITIACGVEVGNEPRRKGLLNKHVSNESYRKAVALCNKHGIRVSCNVILGLPYETEEDIIETAKFCKEIETPNVTVSIFAPYHGSHLYDVCVQEGFIDNSYHDSISIRDTSILNMPQISKERINELYFNFNKMVYGG